MSLPCLSATSSCLVVSVTLTQSTRLLASSGETTRLAVLVNGVDDPVDAGVFADGLVLRVDKDDFEVLVGRVLVNPVGVENAQVGTTASDTLFSGRLEGTLILELVHTLVGWLACINDQYHSKPSDSDFRTVGGTLWNGALATSTTNTDTVDDITLLGLVTQTTCLIRTRWAGSTVNYVQLSKLYYALSANVQRVYSRDRHKDVHKESSYRCPFPCPLPQYSIVFCSQIRRANPKYWVGFDVDVEVVG